MPRLTRSSYDHRWTKLPATFNGYRISWTFDTKVQGSRLRFPRTVSRMTDYDGAVRFAKKWNLTPPPPIE